MKLSCSTWCFNTMSPEDVYAQIGSYGAFQGVEAVTHRPSFHLDVQWPDERVAAIKQVLADNNLELSAVSPATEFVQFDEDGRNGMIHHTMAHIDLACRFGCKQLRIFAGGRVPEGPSNREILDAVVAGLEPTIEYAAEKGVLLSIENHGQFGRTYELISGVFAALKSPWVGMTLHTGGIDRMRDDYLEMVREFAPRITHMHLNDTLPPSAGRFGQCAVGDGTLDIPGILAILNEHNYDGYYNLEFGGDDSDELIRKSLAYLEKLGA
jgi:sugar phosphate isomerase/epimerase